MSLDDLRKQIDDLDERIVALLNERAACAAEIGRVKAKTSADVFVPAREQAVFDHVCGVNKGPLSDTHLRFIFREVMSATKNIEGGISVAYWNPPNFSTYRAAQLKFGSSARFEERHSVEEVFARLAAGECNYAVVPIENTVEGTEISVLDAFAEYELGILGEVGLRRELPNSDTSVYERYFIIQQDVKLAGEKCSVCLELEDKSGALVQVLGLFKSFSLSLSKLESRPIPERPGEYLFFIDFKGQTDEAFMQEVLAALKEVSNQVKFLGAYSVDITGHA